MNTCELANNHAIDFFISDLGGISHAEFYDTLASGEIHEKATIWEPFDAYSPECLLYFIENLTLSFINFNKDNK